jgi:outer membrane protein assembly factor BamB
MSLRDNQHDLMLRGGKGYQGTKPKKIRQKLTTTNLRIIMKTRFTTVPPLRLACALLLPALLACMQLRADPTLVNVQFREYTSAVKTGTEAVGYSSSDVWNQVVGGDNGEIVLNCVDSTGASTPITVTIDNIDVGLAMSTTGDPLFQSAAGESAGGNVTLTLSLPTGDYDVYLWGTYIPPRGPVQNSTFQVISGIHGVSDYSSYNFTARGGFAGISVTRFAPLVIQVQPGSVLAAINGMQIIQHTGPVGGIKWTFPLPPADAGDGTFFEPSPAIGLDCSVIVASAAKIYSLDPASGSPHWGGGSAYIDPADVPNSHSHGALSSPSIGTNGTIYIGNVDGRVIAMNPFDGSLPWGLTPTPALPGSVFSTPTIAANGNIYFASDDDGGFNGISPVDGTSLPGWTPFPGIGDLDGSLAITADGDVLAMPEHDNALVLIGTGDVIAGQTPGAVITTGGVSSDLTSDSFPKLPNTNPNVGPHFNSSPAIDNDGTIYIGNEFGLQAVDSSLNLKWDFIHTSGAPQFPQAQSSPAIGPDGTIYFGGDDGILYALPAGFTGGPLTQPTPVWTFTPPWGGTWAPIVSSPAVAQDGTVYITMRNINDPANPGQTLSDPTTAPCVLFAVKKGA